jgi:inorganic triphosphatase YgiF
MAQRPLIRSVLDRKPRWFGGASGRDRTPGRRVVAPDADAPHIPRTACTVMTDVENTRALETEVRFSLPAEARSRLEAHPAFDPTRATAPETLHQVTTYFDTPDLALARHGVSLRVRRNGEARVQTVKWREHDGHSPFGRGEREWPVDRDEPDLSLVADTPAGAALEGCGPVALRPAFVTDVRRARRYLLPEADTVVEAVLDEGTISAGSVREGFQELELELKAGDPVRLYRLALELSGALPLALSVASKSERGHRLATGAMPAAWKAEPLDLPRGIDAAEGFRRILGAALVQLLANQPAAAAGEADGVHQMRIAVRRLRSAIALFRPHLVSPDAARFDAELKRLGRVLGQVRDWDVFRGEVLPAAGRYAPEAQPRLLEGPASEERAEAYRRLADELGGPAFTSLVLGLAVWAEERPEGTPVLADGHSGERLADLAPELLRRTVRKALRRGRRIRRRSPEELHDLRKSLKRLRYSVEFLSGLCGRKRTRAYLRACKDLQERLGAINDAALAAEMTGRLAGVAARTTLAPAFGAVSEWSEERGTGHLRRLPDAWDRFKALPPPVH